MSLSIRYRSLHNVVIKENDKPYLALGADLSEDQKNTVLSLMGIDPAQLGNYRNCYPLRLLHHFPLMSLSIRYRSLLLRMPEMALQESRLIRRPEEHCFKPDGN